MSESVFQGLTIGSSSHILAVPHKQFAVSQRVISVLFDDLKAEALPAAQATADGWNLRLIDIKLASPTRRAFVLTANCALMAIGQTSVSARLSVNGQTTVRQVRSNGELREMNAMLKLHVKRSPYPRDSLRIVLMVEAESRSTNGDGLAVIDGCDVLAA